MIFRVHDCRDKIIFYAFDARAFLCRSSRGGNLSHLLFYVQHSRMAIRRGLLCLGRSLANNHQTKAVEACGSHKACTVNLQELACRWGPSQPALTGQAAACLRGR